MRLLKGKEELSAAEDTRSPAAERVAAGRFFERALLKSVGVAVLIAIVPLSGHAQNAANTATNDRAQVDSVDRAPIVIVPSRRVPLTVPSRKNGPIVVPQHAVAADPAARASGQSDDRPEVRLPARSETVVAPAAAPQARAAR